MQFTAAPPLAMQRIQQLIDHFGPRGFGLNVTRTITSNKVRVVASFSRPEATERVRRMFDAEVAPRPLLWAFAEDALKRSEFGAWLTPLDQPRSAWDGRPLLPQVKRWNTCVDYTYSHMVTAGLLQAIWRAHWREYLDADSGAEWQVRTCHETHLASTPRVVTQLDPSKYHRVTRLRLRMYFSPE